MLLQYLWGRRRPGGSFWRHTHLSRWVMSRLNPRSCCLGREPRTHHKRRGELLRDTSFGVEAAEQMDAQPRGADGRMGGPKLQRRRGPVNAENAGAHRRPAAAGSTARPTPEAIAFDTPMGGARPSRDRRYPRGDTWHGCKRARHDRPAEHSRQHGRRRRPARLAAVGQETGAPGLHGWRKRGRTGGRSAA